MGVIEIETTLPYNDLRKQLAGFGQEHSFAVTAKPGDLGVSTIGFSSDLVRDDVIARLERLNAKVRVLPLPTDLVSLKDRPAYSNSLHMYARDMKEKYLVPVNSFFNVSLAAKPELPRGICLFAQGPTLLDWAGYPLRLSGAYSGLLWCHNSEIPNYQMCFVLQSEIPQKKMSKEEVFEITPSAFFYIGDKLMNINLRNSDWLTCLKEIIIYKLENDPDSFRSRRSTEILERIGGIKVK